MEDKMKPTKADIAELDAAMIKYVESLMAEGATREEAFAQLRAQIPLSARATFRVVPKSEKEG
jgi:hypothetical protein